jgi:hypothetical protein
MSVWQTWNRFYKFKAADDEMTPAAFAYPAQIER